MGRGDFNASQGGAHSRGAAASDRDIEAVVMRVLGNKLGLDARMTQDLQALAGMRAEGQGDKPKAAVRRVDLSAIGTMPALTSKEAVGSVSVEDFNALRLDVRRIFEALAHIAQALK